MQFLSFETKILSVNNVLKKIVRSLAKLQQITLNCIVYLIKCLVYFYHYDFYFLTDVALDISYE